jgi:hypothetical protein
VNKDGAEEIVTVGCMYKDVLCDPDLRIRSIPTTQIPFLLVTDAVAGTASAFIAVLLLVRKRQRATRKAESAT